MSEPIAKYGVETDPADVPPGTKCPRCNAILVLRDPPRCRLCGTEPFEPRDTNDVEGA